MTLCWGFYFFVLLFVYLVGWLAGRWLTICTFDELIICLGYWFLHVNCFFAEQPEYIEGVRKCFHLFYQHLVSINTEKVHLKHNDDADYPETWSFVYNFKSTYPPQKVLAHVTGKNYLFIVKFDRHDFYFIYFKLRRCLSEDPSSLNS